MNTPYGYWSYLVVVVVVMMQPDTAIVTAGREGQVVKVKS
jgi:hypothetical protein